MDFTEKLRLRGQAAEDIFFAELDRQLIEAMHEKQRQQQIEEAEDDNPILEISNPAK